MSLSKLQRALAAEAARAEVELEAALRRLASAHARGEARDDVLAEMAQALSRLLAAADLGGRIELRFGADAASPAKFASWLYGGVGAVEATEAGDVVPSVAFEAALADLQARDAIGAEELRRMGLEVTDAYGPLEVAPGAYVYPHGFALARAADSETASRVQSFLAAGLRDGRTTDDVANEIASTWDWPVSYAANVTRTNYATATSAGRFREAERVERAGILVGFMVQTAGDSSVRPGHRAMDGFKARIDDPVWRSWSVPYSWNCRCVMTPIFGDEVPVDYVKGVPAGAEKDVGFGSRPDLSTYGA